MERKEEKNFEEIENKKQVKKTELIEQIKALAPNIKVDFLIHSRKKKLIEILIKLHDKKTPDAPLKKGYKTIDGEKEKKQRYQPKQRGVYKKEKYQVIEELPECQKSNFENLIEEFLKDINAGISLTQKANFIYNDSGIITGYTYDNVIEGIELKKCIFILMNKLHPNSSYAVNVLESIRLIQGMNSSEFARMIGVSKQAYSCLKERKTISPRATIKKICILLTDFNENDFEL